MNNHFKHCRSQYRLWKAWARNPGVSVRQLATIAGVSPRIAHQFLAANRSTQKSKKADRERILEGAVLDGLESEKNS
jgi:hypothetical protein